MISGRRHKEPCRRYPPLILIVASIPTPIYLTSLKRAREAVLSDHLDSLRARPSRSPPRKRGSTHTWIPAFAGMTGAQRPLAAGGTGWRRRPFLEVCDLPKGLVRLGSSIQPVHTEE